MIHSIGKILDTKSGKYLAKGARIEESASLMFETKGARAAVLSSSRGRFVIQEASTSESKSDVVYTLTSVLSPARGKLSTRAGGINNKLDFEKYFGEDAVVLLGDSFSLKVSPTAYPMNESKFFYAQYQYKGEVINKKLASEEDKLILRTSEFFSVDGNAISTTEVSDIKLFYYDAAAQESSLLTPLKFALVSTSDLKSLSEEMEGDEGGLLEIINSLYGKCSLAYLKDTLNSLE